MSEWKACMLSDLISTGEGSIKTGPFGTALKAAEYSKIGVPVVSVGEIGYGRLGIRADTPRVSTDTVRRLSSYVLNEDDIVLARKGSVDRSAIIRPAEDGYFLGSDGIRVRLDGSNSAKFVAYQILSPQVRKWILQHVGGSTMASLNQDVIGRIPLLLPPLPEQRRIAGVLGALDDLIDTNERLMDNLDALGMAHFLNNWDRESWVEVSSLGEVVMGQSPPGSTFNEDGQGIPFFQGVRDFGRRFPSERVYCTQPTRLAAAGDILIAVRAPVGDTNVARAPSAIGRGLAALKAEHPSAALRALRSTAETWSAHQGTGTVFSSINGKDLRAAKVPAVDPCVVEELLESLDAQYLACAEEVATLRRTRDELLPLLMSGKVRVAPIETGGPDGLALRPAEEGAA